MEIKLTTGEVILVDEGLYSLLSKFKWRRTGGEVKRSTWNKKTRGAITESLSRFLKGKPPEGHVWYHVNGDLLDFREENLALAKRGQNPNLSAAREMQRQSRRTDKPAGVYQRGGSFLAMTRVNKKQKALGTFDSEAKAAYAYNYALLSMGVDPVNPVELTLEEKKEVQRVVSAKLGIESQARPPASE